MAITKQVTILVDGITERGQIHVKTSTRVLEDGALLGESVHRKVLSPGESLTGEAEQVAAIANAVWTPEVLAAWDGDHPASQQVPQEVTRRQARQALLIAGKLDLVQPAINALPEPQRTMMQIEWDDSQTFQRTRPSLIAMATAIGLDDAGLDALFEAASKL